MTYELSYVAILARVVGWFIAVQECSFGNGKLMYQPKSRRNLAIETLEGRRLLALNPSAIEQELLHLINVFRTDPTNEYNRLIQSSAPLRSHDPEVTTQLTISGVDATMLSNELATLTPSPPLAWNEVIQDLATTQNGTMISRNSQEHFPNLANTLFGMGVPIEAGTGQNAFYNSLGIGKTPFFVHSAFVIDWANGLPGATGGMQAGRGHRVNLMNTLYNQIGSAVTPFASSLVNTQFLAKVASSQKLAVGAIYEDKNNSGRYEAGEGIGGAQITFQGATGTFNTTAMSAGGYQIVLPAGTYTATASGGALSSPVVLNNIIVGANNVFANFVFDPTVVVVTPDASEPNNSTAAATALTGVDQSLDSLSIHAGDSDYFRFTSRSTGSATVNLQFTHANGDLDLRFRDASGTILASSITAANTESITANLVRGQEYFVEVFSATGSSNPQYTLQLNLPEPLAPTAVADRGLTEESLTLSILANDSDPDGNNASLVPVLGSSSGGTFVLAADGTLDFRKTPGFTGFARATYHITDDQGLQSNPANIDILVLDFARTTPWRNDDRPMDVNDDGFVTALDALLLISDLNSRGRRNLAKTLPSALPAVPFPDTSGSNSVEPHDVLLIIAELNRLRRNGSGEGEAANRQSVTQLNNVASDLAVLQLMSAGSVAEFELRKRRT